MDKPKKNDVTFALWSYNKVIKWIEQKYGIKTRDYSGVEDKDFWHFLLEWYFENVSDGCIRTLFIKDMIDSKDTPDWAKQILQCIYDEFHEDFGTEGEMTFWIEW